MQTPDPIPEFIHHWLAAWTGNQPERLLAFYAADAYYSDPAKPQGLKGHHQLRPYFTKLLALNPHWQWRALEWLEAPAACALKWEATLPLPRGNTLALQGLDIVTVQGNLITRNEVYFDRTPWLQALQA
jgi:hypothetical protein